MFTTALASATPLCTFAAGASEVEYRQSPEILPNDIDEIGHANLSQRFAGQVTEPFSQAGSVAHFGMDRG